MDGSHLAPRHTGCLICGLRPLPFAVAPPNPLVTQYNEQWDKVCKTPSDFTAWTNLITTAEKLVSAQCPFQPHQQCYGDGLRARGAGESKGAS